MKWFSDVEAVGPVQFPKPERLRVLMMPFRFDNIGTVPFPQWRNAVLTMLSHVDWDGVGYLTIDERSVMDGEIHRRPGLHVDGWAHDGGGTWGGGGGWGGRKSGMLLATNLLGSVAWRQEFHGEPGEYGDCSHLADQCQPRNVVFINPGFVYRLGGLTVHKSIRQKGAAVRQFVRISGPSDAGWNSSNTPSPCGVLPSGPVLPPRPEKFTSYSPLSYTPISEG